MGRPKGTTNRIYSIKEKEMYIKEGLEYGTRTTARKYNISPGMLSNWIKSYKENGDKIIDNKYKKENPLSKYSYKKNYYKNVMTLKVKAIELRVIEQNQTLGYNEGYKANKKTYVAILPVG